jgi:HD-like signal output (HDOD) protein
LLLAAWATSAPEAEELAPAGQALLLLRLLAYDRQLTSRAQDAVTVAIVWDPGDAAGAAQRDALIAAFSKVAMEFTVAGLPVRWVAIASTAADLTAQLGQSRASAAMLVGAAARNPQAVCRATRAAGVLSMSADRAAVEACAAVGLLQRAGKTMVLINLEAAGARRAAPPPGAPMTVARESRRLDAAAPFDLDRAIVDLVSRGTVKIPPYPAIAIQIENLILGGDFGLDELSRLVSSDQVLAADVLRVSNSAAYARGAPVTSATAAAGFLGAKEVAHLALALGLGAHATAPGKLASLRRKVWLDALASAALCQVLAPGRGLAPDDAFSAGLLHDFGKVVCLATIEQLLDHQAVGPDRAEAWTEIVDRYHLELGVVMAARWDLPQVLADVISLHHGDTSAAADRALVDLVVAVDEVTRMLGDRTHLSPEDLGAAALLRSGEGVKVSEALRQLPSFVASFETGEPWKHAGGPSLVAAPALAPPLPEAPPPPAWPVTLTVSGKSFPCAILALNASHLLVRSPSPVPENLLLKLTVECEPPLSGFASVKHAWPEPGGYSLEVQPYALAGDALRRWKKLVAAPVGA